MASDEEEDCVGAVGGAEFVSSELNTTQNKSKRFSLSEELIDINTLLTLDEEDGENW